MLHFNPGLQDKITALYVPMQVQVGNPLQICVKCKKRLPPLGGSPGEWWLVHSNFTVFGMIAFQESSPYRCRGRGAFYSLP